MAENTQNPLSKYFRQPALYIKLPSNGRWYPEGTVEIPVTGDVPIYAMTAKDEITMKTPDALLNGSSTAAVIESCCPAIKDAWKMPLVDLDAILIALRIATYGKQMDFSTVCPHCGTKNEKAVDLTVMLDKVTLADWDSPTEVNGLKINLRPQSYQEFNKNNLMNFEEQRLLQMVQNEDIPDDVKVVKFNEMFTKVVELGIAQVSKGIASITLEDGTSVTDTNFIAEFLGNCDRSVWDMLKTRMDSMREAAQLKVTLTCENPECGKEYPTPFVFEQSSFFE
jgi:hypothetical protein